MNALLVLLLSLPAVLDGGASASLPEPYQTGTLQVSKLHSLYYELSGNKDGFPLVILHGGPGGGSSPKMRGFGDASKWKLILYDQRGAGKSTPFAELHENTTPHLVEDLERLRQHLGIEKMVLLGGSWGSTLALAYAEAYPSRVTAMVLRGVFTCMKEEIHHFYHGGVEPYFPEVYAALREVIPNPKRRDWPKQLLDLLNGPDTPERKRVARAWALYETRLSRLGITDAETVKRVDEDDPLAFARIENHYLSQGCFMPEGKLWRDLKRIADIPMVIVHGRHDVICRPIVAWRLHRALPKSRLVWVEDAGHSSWAPSMLTALTQAVKSLEPVAMPAR